MSPVYVYDTDEDEPIDADSDKLKELPVHLFSSSAPRLRTVALSGIRMGTVPLPIFHHVTNLALDLTTPTFRLYLHTHFPALLDLAIKFEEPAVPGTIAEGAFALPQTLRAMDLCAPCRNLDELYELFRLDDIVSLADLRVEVSRFAGQYRFYLAPLRSSSNVTLRVHFEKTKIQRVGNCYNRVPLPSEIRLSLAADSGLARTVTFYTNEEDGYYNDDPPYDPEAEWEDRFDSRMFEPFKFISTFNQSITSIVITHEFVPLLFQHFNTAALETLTDLEIDLDVFRGPFWVTQATDVRDDFSDGDKDEVPWPTPAKAGRGIYPGEEIYDSDESGEFCDGDGYMRAITLAIDRAYAREMLNRFDEEEESHSLECPRLETVRLCTSYGDPQPVQTRQLAHFGRALGLLERAPEKKPRLLLRGVQLSCATRETLHLEVFTEPVIEPVNFLKSRDININDY